MRRAARTDLNHAAIRDALRRIPGVTVADTSALGNGYPDLMVAASEALTGRKAQWFAVEIKNPKQSKSRQKLRPKQVAFKAEADRIGAPYLVATTITDVLVALGIAQRLP